MKPDKTAKAHALVLTTMTVVCTLAAGAQALSRSDAPTSDRATMEAAQQPNPQVASAKQSPGTRTSDPAWDVVDIDQPGGFSPASGLFNSRESLLGQIAPVSSAANFHKLNNTRSAILGKRY